MSQIFFFCESYLNDINVHPDTPPQNAQLSSDQDKRDSLCYDEIQMIDDRAVVWSAKFITHIKFERKNDSGNQGYIINELWYEIINIKDISQVLKIYFEQADNTLCGIVVFKKGPSMCSLRKNFPFFQWMPDSTSDWKYADSAEIALTFVESKESSMDTVNRESLVHLIMCRGSFTNI